MDEGNNKNIIDVEHINLESIESNLGDADFNMAKEKISLAKSILICLFLLTIYIITSRLFFGERTSDDLKDVFSTVFQSIVPMSSLVIGYYFGSKCDKE
ncbi:hypothetical protein [Escherichia coli]|uniref:hypothetical protein n=1 Tax=Escherichia coli TaxID=562 RepID=UPI001CC0C3A5|nr:hypothetical protein [Escherichia coli]MCD9134049.1 hypothetical protein [Escherichia coli]